MKMEDVIGDEIGIFHKDVESYCGQAVDIKYKLKQRVANIATHIALGRKVEYEVEKLDVAALDEFFAIFFKTLFFPFLRV